MPLDFGFDMATEADVNDDIIAKNIPLDMIDDDPNNQEIFSMSNIAELAGFIDKVGFIGAIDVFKKDDGRYQIIAGHRRVRAMKKLGRKEIPAIISEEGKNIERAHKLIGSNLLSRAVSPMEKAKAYYFLLTEESGTGKKGKGKFNESAFNDVCKTYGVNKSYLSKIVRLVSLIPELQEMVEKDIVAWTSVYTISDRDEEIQKKIADAILKRMEALPEEEQKFTAAEIEAIVRSVTEKKVNKTVAQKASKVQSSVAKVSKEMNFLVKLSDEKLKKSPEDMHALEESVESIREILVKLEEKLAQLKK